MNFVLAGILTLGAILIVSAIVSHFGARHIARANPPIGEFAVVNGTKLHFVQEGSDQERGDKAGDEDGDLPPVVFLHGATGNLRDQMLPFADRLRGRARTVFVDRPGHGWSERGPGTNATPDGQAATIAALLDHLGIDRAIVVGHSFGTAIAIAFALNHPERTIGNLLLAPVSHPWPGGISWYYTLAAMPVLGPLFVHTLVLPFGLKQMKSGTEGVFTPNRPIDSYAEKTGVALVFRPAHFRANAIDVANLYDYVTRTSPRYGEIENPTIVVTGDREAVVLPRVHAVGLEKALPHVEAVWLKNVGHKPDYVASDLAVMAIEKLAGKSRDLQKAARRVEARVAEDNFGPVEKCFDQ